MTRISELARAKINLTLHVGPAQSGGYHPLESLVVFADIGDEVSVETRAGNGASLTIDGPFGSGLSVAENLILQTAAFIKGTADAPARRAYHLTKNLPIASGIGGGSADAAAVIRLRARETGEDLAALSDGAEKIGADVPVCIHSRTGIMSGIGEKITHLPGKGQVPALLVNPGVAVSTGKIFGLLDHGDKLNQNWQTPLPLGGSLQEICQAGRNDLQAVAVSICPRIDTVLKTLNQQNGIEIARMSGSGATCFGLFETAPQAAEAARVVSKLYPDWWCAAVMLGDNYVP